MSVHWVGDAPTSLHGNGASSFESTTREIAEVTCKLCLALLALVHHHCQDCIIDGGERCCDCGREIGPVCEDCGAAPCACLDDACLDEFDLALEPIDPVSSGTQKGTTESNDEH